MNNNKKIFLSHKSQMDSITRSIEDKFLTAEQEDSLEIQNEDHLKEQEISSQYMEERENEAMRHGTLDRRSE